MKYQPVSCNAATVFMQFHPLVLCRLMDIHVKLIESPCMCVCILWHSLSLSQSPASLLNHRVYCVIYHESMNLLLLWALSHRCSFVLSNPHFSSQHAGPFDSIIDNSVVYICVSIIISIPSIGSCFGIEFTEKKSLATTSSDGKYDILF